jgi:hypothetical protein
MTAIPGSELKMHNAIGLRCLKEIGFLLIPWLSNGVKLFILCPHGIEIIKFIASISTHSTHICTI